MNNKLNIILFGPPGAGKGTQSEKLLAHYQLKHISTGDILRAERKAGTELGQQANAYIEKGELVPDHVVIGMVEQVVRQHPDARGFIFDGFPRTEAQGAALDQMLEHLGMNISMVLALQVDEEELTRRLLERGKLSGRADDQDEATIRNRFRVYNNETSPLIAFYEKQGKLQQVQGMGSVDEIFYSLCRCIDNASETH
ncbi:MAG: adenylate kinase [Bacteroidetes bacterium]|nr:adenylate kinase [Bacteroidota bacterium]